jgi:DNA-binding CsgD family transcriptional regulator
MRLMHGRSLKEISRTLNISVAAVKARLYRARQQLSAACGSAQPLTWREPGRGSSETRYHQLPSW